MLLVAAMFLALFALAAPASATGGGPSEDNNKKVTLCHATASDTNPYEKIEVSVHAFYNAGHIDHVQGGNADIYEGFTWTDNKGVEHVVPSQGDLSLLAFPDCERPDEDTPVAIPDAQVVDKCAAAEDAVNLVRSGEGFTAELTGTYPNFTATVTAAEGFVLNPRDGWTLNDAKTVATKTFSAADFPNNDACDLPETGDTTTNVVGGLLVLGLIAAGAVFLARRRTA